MSLKSYVRTGLQKMLSFTLRFAKRVTDGEGTWRGLIFMMSSMRQKRTKEHGYWSNLRPSSTTKFTGGPTGGVALLCQVLLTLESPETNFVHPTQSHNRSNFTGSS